MVGCTLAFPFWVLRSGLRRGITLVVVGVLPLIDVLRSHGRRAAVPESSGYEPSVSTDTPLHRTATVVADVRRVGRSVGVRVIYSTGDRKTVTAIAIAITAGTTVIPAIGCWTDSHADRPPGETVVRETVRGVERVGMNCERSALFVGFTAAPLQAFARRDSGRIPGTRAVHHGRHDPFRPAQKPSAAPGRLTAPCVNVLPEGRGALLENETPDRAAGAETEACRHPPSPRSRGNRPPLTRPHPRAPVVSCHSHRRCFPRRPGRKPVNSPTKQANDNAKARGAAKGESCPKSFHGYSYIYIVLQASRKLLPEGHDFCRK